MIQALLGAILPSIVGTIDKAVEDKDLKRQLERDIELAILKNSTAIEKSAADIVLAETNGSWLQRNWRPGLMVFFAGLVGAHWFGFTAPNIPESVQNGLLDIVMVGVGGYVLGRSGEKIVEKYKE